MSQAGQAIGGVVVVGCRYACRVGRGDQAMVGVLIAVTAAVPIGADAGDTVGVIVTVDNGFAVGVGQAVQLPRAS